MIEYLSVEKYVLSITNLEDRVTKTWEMIQAMEELLLTRASDTDASGAIQYRIDDGQVKIEAMYPDQSAFVKTIKALRELLQMWIADLNTAKNGRVFRLTSNNNFC